MTYSRRTCCGAIWLIGVGANACNTLAGLEEPLPLQTLEEVATLEPSDAGAGSEGPGGRDAGRVPPSAPAGEAPRSPDAGGMLAPSEPEDVDENANFENGATANNFADCMAAPAIVAPPAPARVPILDAAGNDYGAVEWRVGTVGTCAGSSWAHVNLSSLPIPQSLEIRYTIRNGTRTLTGFRWLGGLPLGEHEGPVVIDTRELCASLVCPDTPSGSCPFFAPAADADNLFCLGTAQ
jgi:hypothetical protein